MSLIRHFAFVVGAEYIRNTLASVGSGGIVTSAPSSGPVVRVNEALLSFSSMDHASLLGLGDLDSKEFESFVPFLALKALLRVW